MTLEQAIETVRIALGDRKPKDLTFASVNDFVHNPGVPLEYLQSLCLTLATALEKANAPVQPNEAMELADLLEKWGSAPVQVHKAAAMLRRLSAENAELRIDSSNYRSKCEVCNTANMDTLTDDHCERCEIERLRAAHAATVERLRGLAQKYETILNVTGNPNSHEVHLASDLRSILAEFVPQVAKVINEANSPEKNS